MKNVYLALLIALGLALANNVMAQTDATTPTPAPAASPLPTTEPAPSVATPCPVCKMDAAKATCGKSMDCDSLPCDRKDAAQSRPGEAEKTVRQLEQQWCEAEARHDVASLEKFEADTFTFTDSTGRLTTKQDEIATARQGGDPIGFKLTDVKAQIYGDAAILTGQTSFDAGDTNSATASAYRWTDVFVHQPNGEWRVVASQATAVGPVKGAGGGSGE